MYLIFNSLHPYLKDVTFSMTLGAHPGLLSSQVYSNGPLNSLTEFDELFFGKFLDIYISTRILLFIIFLYHNFPDVEKNR